MGAVYNPSAKDGEVPDRANATNLVTSKLRDAGVNIRSAEEGAYGENIIEIVASSATPALAFMSVAKKVESGGKILKAVASNPKIFAALEAAAATSAGISRATVENIFPDSPIASTIAEIVGGVLGGTAPLMVARKARGFIGDVMSDVRAPAESRASKQLQLQADDPLAAADELDRNLKTITTGKDTPIQGVEPARQTNDQGLILMARQEEQANASAALTRQASLSSEVQDDIRSTLGGGGGNEQALVSALQKKKAVFEKRIDTRIKEAQAKASSAVDDLGEATPQRRADASVAQTQIIDRVYRDTTAREKDIWSKIDLKKPVAKGQLLPLDDAISSITDKFGTMSNDLPRDMFARVKEMAKRATKNELLLNDLKQFRSEIGSGVANQLGAQVPNRRTVMALNELDSAVLKIMEKSDPSGAFSNAIAFSRAKHDKFNRGEIGRVRGVNIQGTDIVRDEITLKKLIRREEEGLVSTDDLFSAVKGGDGVAPATQETVDAVSDYVTGLFANTVVKDGKVNRIAGDKFLNAYSAILDKTPAAKALIQNAVSTGATAEKITSLGEQAVKQFSGTQGNRRALMKVLDFSEDPAAAISSIASSRNPGKQFKELVIDASGDPKATAGLKDVVADYVIEQSTVAQEIGGVNLLTSGSINDKLPAKFIAAIERSGLYTKPQVHRLKTVMKNIAQNTATSNAVKKDGSSTFQNFINHAARLVALRHAAPITGGGPGSLAASQRISSMVGEFVNKIGVKETKALINKAVLDDPKLLSTLLRKPQTQKEAKEIVRKLNLFLLSSGTRATEEQEN